MAVATQKTTEVKAEVEGPKKPKATIRAAVSGPKADGPK